MGHPAFLDLFSLKLYITRLGVTGKKFVFTEKRNSFSKYHVMKFKDYVMNSGKISALCLSAILLLCNGCVNESNGGIVGSLTSALNEIKLPVAKQNSSSSKIKVYSGILTVKSVNNHEEYYFKSFEGHNIYIGSSTNAKIRSELAEAKEYSKKLSANTYWVRLAGYMYQNNGKMQLDPSREFSVYEETHFVDMPKKLGVKKVCGTLEIAREENESYYILKNYSPKIKKYDAITITTDRDDDIMGIIDAKYGNGDRLCVSGDIMQLSFDVGEENESEDNSMIYFATGEKMEFSAR